jgi:hypothetical protein
MPAIRGAALIGWELRRGEVRPEGRTKEEEMELGGGQVGVRLPCFEGRPLIGDTGERSGGWAAGDNSPSREQ